VTDDEDDDNESDDDDDDTENHKDHNSVTVTWFGDISDA